MVVDAGLHQRSQTQVVLRVNVEFLPAALGPAEILEEQLKAISKTTRANDVKSVTPVGIGELDGDLLLQQELHNV